MKARFTLIAALAAAVVPSKGWAQAWLSSPDFSEGAGIRAGDLEVHPSVGAEFGYDSNYLLASKDEGVVDALKLRVTPSITLSTLGRQRRGTAAAPKVAFSAGAYASYFELFPLDSANSDLSKRRNVALGADATANVFPSRPLGFDLAAGFVRVVQGEGRSDNLTSEGYNRDTLRGGAGVTWRPGGGLFEWRVGYNATYNFFENDTYSSLSNLHHQFGTRGRWRFLPRSALLFDSSYTMVRYTDSAAVQSDGDAIRAQVGFHGLVTYHLALLGMVGWASSFYDRSDTQFDGPIANAELRWFIQAQPDLQQASVTSGISSLALGYNRGYENSYLGSFYQRDRGYVQLNAFLIGAIASGLEFGVSRVAFPEVRNESAFRQLRIDGRLFGEYRFTDTLAANATIQYDRVNSPSVAAEQLEFTRWQAYVGVRWFM
jgi:hypothetical protein